MNGDFNNTIKSIAYSMQRDVLRNIYQPTILETMGMAPSVRAAYHRERERELEVALEELRLDFEVGPRLGPDRRDFNATPLQKGRRALARVKGRPAGKLVRT